MVVTQLFTEGSKHSVEFIFDQQNGVQDDIPLFFEYMIRSLPKPARALIAGTPQFRDDKDFVTLQAADMLAWHVRREFSGTSGKSAVAAISPINSQHFVTEIDGAALQRMGSGMSKIHGADLLRGKIAWQKFKRELRHALAHGYVPPHGTRWRNAMGAVRGWVRKF